jgi:NitT/TauT family transport system substrate-binding protein
MEPVTVAATDLPGSSAIIVADEKGFFLAEGLDVTVLRRSSGREALVEVIAGAADFATVGDTPFARAVVEGKAVKVIASIGENSYANAIVARRDRGVFDPQDLREKRVGRVPWTTADFFLHAYLTISYVDPEEVTVIDYDPQGLPHALLTGEVDAISTWPPYATIVAEQLQTNAVILHDPGVYTMMWNVAIRSEWAARRPDTIRKFLRALLRSSRFIKENPGAACGIYAKRTEVDLATAAAAWKGWQFNVGLDQSLILDLEDQARWILRRNKANQSTPNFLEFIDCDGLRAVQPVAVTIPGK